MTENLTSEELIDTIGGMAGMESDTSIIGAVTTCPALMQYLLSSALSIGVQPTMLGLFLALGITIGLKVKRRRVEVAELEKLNA